MRQDEMEPYTPLIGAPVEWAVLPGLTGYAEMRAVMEARQQAIFEGREREIVWLLEHPPLYTAGTSADPSELLEQRFPVFEAGRGGRYTYHGPGQRTGYVLVNLAERCRDVRCYVHALEGWVIAALAGFGVQARRAEGRIGIWCDDRDGREAKIGAIGVRIRRWVSAHGFAVNISPDLSHFGGIVPCGISEYPVTSLAALGIEATPADFDKALHQSFPDFLLALAKAGGNCDIADT